MLTKKMAEALNNQINAEYYSAYLYLSMAAYCDSINLKGFANWFRVQNLEEMVHVMKFFTYVLDRKNDVELKAIAGPPTKWASPQAVFEAALTHEQHVTSLINKLADLALSESDHATSTLLQWFITEQIEEESSADAIVQQLKLAGDNPTTLFMLDRELATRVFVPPATGATPAP
jgi:ferritin